MKITLIYKHFYIKINLPKNQHSKIYDDKAIISCKKCMLKRKKEHVFSQLYGFPLSTFYPTVSGITIPIGQCLNEQKELSVPYGRSDPNYT